MIKKYNFSQEELEHLLDAYKCSIDVITYLREMLDDALINDYPKDIFDSRLEACKSLINDIEDGYDKDNESNWFYNEGNTFLVSRLCSASDLASSRCNLSYSMDRYNINAVLKEEMK